MTYSIPFARLIKPKVASTHSMLKTELFLRTFLGHAFWQISAVPDDSNLFGHDFVEFFKKLCSRIESNDNCVAQLSDFS